jgi:hypothetical protein
MSALGQKATSRCSRAASALLPQADIPARSRGGSVASIALCWLKNGRADYQAEPALSRRMGAQKLEILQRLVPHFTGENILEPAGNFPGGCSDFMSPPGLSGGA